MTLVCGADRKAALAICYSTSVQLWFLTEGSCPVKRLYANDCQPIHSMKQKFPFNLGGK
jgi:hypothetical protein